MDRDALKAAAAKAATDEVASGMVLGLGTGSTASHAIQEVGRRMEGGLLADISGVPTSDATEDLARSLGIRILEPGAAPIDLAIDGADEVAPDLALTKGGGGALLREKVVASASARFIVVADDSKLVPALGTTFDIPIEVARFGVAITSEQLAEFGTPQLRSGEVPWVSENGNLIVDLAVEPIADPAAFDRRLGSIAGVLATGLFVDLADAAYIGGPSGVRVIKPAEEDA